MTLKLHFHPLSSFCQKVLTGLYELDLPFERHIVDLMDPQKRAEFHELWGIGKFPVLRDERSGLTLPETTIILEYLDRHVQGRARLIPTEPAAALECRLRDRFFDLYVNTPMGKIVTDNLRPADRHDPFGVAEARAQLARAYAIADGWLREGTWAAGDAFSIADCAAAPALFYANKVAPFAEHRHLSDYYARLEARPSFARVLAEAEPYMQNFPG